MKTLVRLKNLTFKNVSIMDAIVILAILFPFISTFFPPESYFRANNNVYFQGGQISSAPSGDPFVGKLTFATLILIFTYKYLKNIISIRALLIYCLPILVLVAYMALSCTWSYSFMAGFNKAYRVGTIVLVIIFVFHMYRSQKVVNLVTTSIFIASIFSIFAVLFMPKFGLESLHGYAGAWRGAYVQKNNLGEVMAYGVMYSICSYIISAGSKWRKMAIFSLISCGFLLFMSRSGTSLIACVAAVCVFLILYFFRNIKNTYARLATYLIVAIAATAMAYIALNTDLIFTLTGRNSDFTGRVIIWDNVKSAISEKPELGHGFGYWMTDNSSRNFVWSRIGYKVPHSHNTFLDLTLQFGFVGLALYILMCVSMIVFAIRGIIRNKSILPIFYFSIIVLLLIRDISEVTLGAGEGSIFWYAIPFVGLAKNELSNRLYNKRSGRNSRERGVIESAQRRYSRRY